MPLAKRCAAFADERNGDAWFGVGAGFSRPGPAKAGRYTDADQRKRSARDLAGQITVLLRIDDSEDFLPT